MQQVTAPLPRPDTDPPPPAPAAPVASAASLRAGRRTILGSLVMEVAAGVVWVAAAVSLRGDALVAVAGATAVALVVGRAALGAAEARVPGAIAWAALTLLQAAVLVPGLRESAAAPACVALAGIGVLPLVAGLAPAARAGGLFAGDREDVTPVLLATATASGLGVLAAIALAGAIDVGDGRLEALAPYAAAGMAVLALAEVLAHHRAGTGFADTAAALAATGAGLCGLLLIESDGAPLDTAVTAMGVASGCVAAGMLVATALASPRPLAVPAEHAGSGPRLVAVMLGGLVAVAAAARLAAWRPLWLDEATTARTTSGSLGATLEGARHSSAHPPLAEAAVWASRQVFGGGELALRMPSLVAGLLLVPAVYVTAERLYDRRAALVAAAIAAVGPGALWLSGTARPGMLAALLATLALYTMLRAVERGRPVDWVLFAAAGVALVWSHQLAVLQVAVLVGAVALVGRRRAQRGAPVADLVLGGGLAAAVIGGAFVALVAYRGGLGPPGIPPPLEYATAGAPGAGRSVFGLAGTAVVGVFGFHPADVTSRLLALWPLGILATFALTVRSWSARGALLIALAAAPLVALLVAQIAGVPRRPLFALEWIATALPMVAIGLGRAMAGLGDWRRVRIAGAVLAVVLAVAAADQVLRIEPVDRVDVPPAVERAAAAAGPGDTVVYAPAAIGDLVRYEVSDADVVPLARAGADTLGDARHVVIVAAFGLGDERTRERTLALVDELAASRPLAAEERHGDTTVWSFG
jgi:4-amino-4-deoxy-L-arabinose transferase-like glycosyltransferase